MHIIDKIESIHFIGIGGISMSSLAKLALSLGKKVSGSDASYSKTIVQLAEYGIDAYIGSQPKKVQGVQLVVYSSAIPQNDAELRQALSLNIPTVERYIFLAEVASYYSKCIAVAGTHGKTTVTAMIAHLLKCANYSFTAHIGGYANGGLGNLYITGKEYFITEACEYKKSLLSLTPFISLVLNAEHDHPDTYEVVTEVYDTFATFLGKTHSNGCKIVCADTAFYQNTLIGRQDIFTYGLGQSALLQAVEIAEYKKGFYSFGVKHKGQIICNIALSVIGEFNIYNALAGVAVGINLGIQPQVIGQALSNFSGVKRRFQQMGTINGADVYIDYAHHPREIDVMLRAVEKIKKTKLIVVFQPHTYTRTLSLINEFKECFSCYDELYIVKSYSSREQPEQGMTALELYRNIAHKGGVQYFDSIIELATHLAHSCKSGDIVLILGAGDIDCLADLIID